jgi:phage tail-like protein
MRSRRLLFALLVGLLLTVAAVGAWTATSQGASAPPGGDALTAARFSITIDGTEIAAFAELQGITSGYDIDFIESDGRRLAVPGKRPAPTVTLKRGMTRNMELAAWHELAMNDWAAARKNTTLVMYDAAGTPVARYHLENAWPAKLEIGSLSAGASEVLMETVTLVCDHLQRVSP